MALISPVGGASSVTITSNVVLAVSTGKLTVSASMVMASLTETPTNNTINFQVSGFEAIQQFYVFSVQSYGNGSLNLVFRGNPPIRIASSNIGSLNYDFAKHLENIKYATSQTSSLTVFYIGVGPNIGNGVANGSGLLVAFILLITLGFLVITLVWVKESASRERREPMGVFLSRPMSLLILGIIFIVLLALIAAFTGYFNGIGI